MKKVIRLSRDFDITKDSYGGSQMWLPLRRDVRTGCGPVALANLYAWHSGLNLSKDEMNQLTMEVLRSLNGPVIHPLPFILGARRLFTRRGFDLKATYILTLAMTKNKQQQILQLIQEALAEDRPVPLLMGPNRKKDSYRSEFGNHWVLITGLILDSDRITLEVSSWGQAMTIDFEHLIKSKRMLAVLSLIPVKRALKS